jgi:hypothetical protein
VIWNQATNHAHAESSSFAASCRAKVTLGGWRFSRQLFALKPQRTDIKYAAPSKATLETLTAAPLIFSDVLIKNRIEKKSTKYIMLSQNSKIFILLSHQLVDNF